MGLLKKTALVGIGLVSMTKDKIEKLGKQIAKEANLSEKEGRKFVDDLLKNSEKTKKNIEAKMEKTVKDILKKMDIFLFVTACLAFETMVTYQRE